MTTDEEKAKELAQKFGYAPKPATVNIHSWSMGQRQIAQAKAQGRWRGNNY